jgi:hypothetical protein
MKTQPKYFPLILLSILLTTLLAACGSQVKFSAPEIEPPADLIPSYVPEGFELVSGFQLSYSDFRAIIFTRGEERQIFPQLDLGDAYFSLKSPAGNDVLGVYYQGRDALLLITKSTFPDGSLDRWQEAYEAPFHCEDDDGCDCDCDCDCTSCRECGCLKLAIAAPFPLRFAELQEVRTVGDTQVAVLQSVDGWITVFVRGSDLITVESGISLDENLKVAASLLD